MTSDVETIDPTPPVPLLERWLRYWHGRGEAHQESYYRCEGCHSLVTWHAIRKGGCRCGLSNRLRPAVLSAWDKTCLLLTPWWRCRR